MKLGLETESPLFCVPQRLDGLTGHRSTDKPECTAWISKRIRDSARSGRPHCGWLIRKQDTGSHDTNSNIFTHSVETVLSGSELNRLVNSILSLQLTEKNDLLLGKKSHKIEEKCPFPPTNPCSMNSQFNKGGNLIKSG